MSTDNAKKFSLQQSSAVHFDDRTALHLTQAFNQEESLESLLALVMSQLMALCGASGINYRNDALQIEVDLGREALHKAEYNLSVEERDLGALTIFFPRRRNEQEVQTCEDLLALAFTALRNRIELAEASGSVEAKPAEASLSQQDKADTLILVALDGYQDMRSQSGDEWSQILMNSVHNQIKEGLRNADGVYQIADDLIAVLLPNTAREQAIEVAAKIRVLVSSLHLTSNSDASQLTACMGISDAAHASTAEDVMANAKVALAKAQADGRNSVKVFDEALAAESV